MLMMDICCCYYIIRVFDKQKIVILTSVIVHVKKFVTNFKADVFYTVVILR